MGKIALKSSDNKVFEVEEIAARKLKKLKIMIEAGCADPIISLLDIASKTLAKIIEYCERHTDAEKSSEEELKKFDDEFLDLNQKVVLNIIMAVDHLGMKELFDLTCRKVVDMIRGKYADKIRKTFKLPKYFTTEEENVLVGRLEGCKFM